MLPEKWISEPLRPLKSVTPINFAIPRHAVDCHMHVFGAAGALDPGSPDARYTLPEGSLEQYRALANFLGLERAVLVQPSYYGTDNACLLDAMARFNHPCRGVVFLPDSASPSLIKDYHDKGVRGIRLDFFKATLEEAPQLLSEAAAIARDVGWHIELYSPGHIIAALHDRLAALEINVSVNHMGYMKQGETSEADFARFVELASAPHCWVKLTGPYRIAPDAERARTDAMAQELIEVASDRLVWGSDWPHLPHGSRDTGEILNRFAEWCPDEAVRHAILVRNPSRLYKFEEEENR